MEHASRGGVAVEGHAQQQTTSVPDEASGALSAANASVAKTLDFSEPAISADGDTSASAKPEGLASAPPTLRLDSEDQFVLRQPAAVSIAALKAVAVVAAAATAKPTPGSLLRLRPALTEDARAAVAAVLLENRCAIMFWPNAIANLTPVLVATLAGVGHSSPRNLCLLCPTCPLNGCARVKRCARRLVPRQQRGWAASSKSRRHLEAASMLRCSHSTPLSLRLDHRCRCLSTFGRAKHPASKTTWLVTARSRVG